MLAERVKYGNKLVPVSLDAICKRRGLPNKGPLIDALMRGGVCPSEMPAHLLRERVLRDVETTHAVFLQQRDEMEAAGQLGVVLTRCVLTPPLAMLEGEGMHLDPARVRDEYAIVARRLGELEMALAAMAPGVNMRSPKQLAKLLFEDLKFPAPKDRRGEPVLTAGGYPPTNKDVLRSLKPKTKAQTRFLELRREYGKVSARMTKVMAFFRGIVDQYGGTFRAQFHQTRTATHRLSSTAIKRYIKEIDKETGVQFQNMPREYKKLFYSPDPDYLLVEVDGAQLEFRVAAFLGQDERACRDIVDGEDIHRFTASVLFQTPEDAVSGDQRTAAKAHTFKPLYGGQSGTEREVAYYKAFREKYNQIYRTQMGWAHEVLRHKEIQMPWGMKFYFPDTRMSSSGYISNTPSIFNYPVQNLATAEIIPVSLTYLFWRCNLEGIRARLVNTVHDSVVAMVHKDDISQFADAARRAFFDDTYSYMERIYGLNINVPLGLGFKAGTHWGEGEEVKSSEPYRAVLAA